ncbi:MAG: hypothetical protein ABS904_00265 [Solibacillus isronensis]
MNDLYQLVDKYLSYNSDALNERIIWIGGIAVVLVMVLGLIAVTSVKNFNITLGDIAYKSMMVFGVTGVAILITTLYQHTNERANIERDILNLLEENTEEVSIDQNSVTLDRCDDFKGCVELNDNQQEPIIIVMDSDNLYNLDHTKELILIVPKLDFAERYMLESAGLGHVIAKSIKVKKQ